MNTSIISLYAKAVAFKPVIDLLESPSMPDCKRCKQLTVSESHVENYDSITQWQASRELGVHPNYMQTLSLPMQLDMMTQESFPFKPLGLVHIGNHICAYKLPVLKQKILLVTEFGEIYFHKKGWLFEVFTKAYDLETCPDLSKTDDSKPLIVGNSLYLARTQHQKDKLTNSGHIYKEAPDWLQVEQAKLNQLIQSSEKLQKFDFESDIGRRYAKVSGDYNPIHLHPFTAKMLGFKKAIAHGMFSKAIAISQLQKHNCIGSKSFEVKTVFMQPIALPANVIMSANIIAGERQKDFILGSNGKSKLKVHLLGTISDLN